MVSLQAALAAMALCGSGETVFLDFYADHCAPCRAMAPTIQALIDEGYPVRKVDITREPQLAAKYGVGPIPCYVMVVDGQVVDRVVGGTSYSRLKRMCQWASGQPPSSTSPVLIHLTPPVGRGTPPSGPPHSGPPPGASPSAMPPVKSDAALSIAPQGVALVQPSPVPVAPPPADWRALQSDWIPRGDAASKAAARADARLLAASVRLRIEDPRGHSCGSGTIIDAREGHALILTCAHIFRESQGKGRVEVDLFGQNPAEKVPGRVISYDPKSDVGLVVIRVPGPVAAIPVAPPEYLPKKGGAVVTTGCNNADRPSTRHSRLLSVDRFPGPSNLQVAGMPVDGRSGGGVFSREGRVIGVCIAADPTDQAAFCAALGAIHAELDRAGLSHIYQSPSVPGTELAAADPPPMPKQMPRRSQSPSMAEGRVGPVTDPSGGASRLGETEQAALDEIRRHLEEGAEVICVIRSRKHPEARSEIIMLDKVSPDFLQLLAAEARAGNARENDAHELRKTLLEIPRQGESSPAWTGRTDGSRQR